MNNDMKMKEKGLGSKMETVTWKENNEKWRIHII